MSTWRRALRWPLLKFAGKAARFAQIIELGPRRAAYDAWVRDRGDATHRLAYALGPDDVVWDAGGYEGQWASDVVARFGCRVHVFEPAPDFARAIRERFAANPRVTVHPFALGASDGEMKLTLSGDGSSLVDSAHGGSAVTVQVRDVASVWQTFGTGRVALFKINIEGAEYELLERLVASGCIAAIGDLQVQFHDFVPEANRRRREVTALLERTHERTWCYDFVWENWRRRTAPSV